MTPLLFSYHFLWTCLIILFLPLIPFTKGSRIHERLGIGLPSSNRLGRGSIWIHALSVGEVISSLPLIRAIKRKYPGKDIVVSVTTSQGMEIAHKELQGEVDKLVTMPIDLLWSVHKMVVFTNPSLFVLVEIDIWPGLIFHLKEKGSIYDVAGTKRKLNNQIREINRGLSYNTIACHDLKQCIITFTVSCITKL